jgi:hypothetical protein
MKSDILHISHILPRVLQDPPNILIEFIIYWTLVQGGSIFYNF